MKTKDIKANFHVDAVPQADGSDLVEETQPEPKRLRFLVDSFQPAKGRLLLKMLPPMETDSWIVKPQIAEERSEYGRVIAIGADVPVPVGVAAKFSKYSSAEEIHFEDEEKGDEYVLVFAEDIRGWLV